MRLLILLMLLVILIPMFFAMAGMPAQANRDTPESSSASVQFEAAACAQLPDPERRLCDYGPLFNGAGQQSRVDARLLAAVAFVESGFATDVINCNRTSEDDARGLMQFMPATAQERGVDPCDPSSAIFGAAAYLRELHDSLGSLATRSGSRTGTRSTSLDQRRWELALAGYNGGPQAVRNAGGIPQGGETERYVPQVMGKWEQYRSLFPTAGGIAGCPVAAPSGSTAPIRDARLTGATRAMANAVISCFGRGGEHIGCYDARRGNGGKYEHPRGRACDFMITGYRETAEGDDRARGQAMAEWVVDHADELNVLYVIWYRRIWTAGEDAAGIPWGQWDRYNGPNPHTDHVHVSVKLLPGDPSWAQCRPGISCTE